MFITVTHCTTTSKESGCGIACILCEQTLPKRYFANVNLTSNCDVTNSLYPVSMTTIRHWSILEFGRRAYIQAVAPDRFARLPFLRSNFRNLVSFQVCWSEKF